MAGARRIDVQFLADDLREIAALLPEGMSQEGLARLLGQALTLFRRDEAAWQHLESRDGPRAEAERTELKRRETTALLVSMRSRTILSEMEMYELRERVRELGRRHAEQRAEADRLRQSIARLHRRIAQVEALLAAAAPSSNRDGARSPERGPLTGWWRKRNG
ncbi:MAG: hypothetical protein QN141_00010 [Armatimonadota bacterium]|nr:hypothetical protein [Armatimonadota bacterium]MDR7452782.1 hypothetical protein [Armatimonadota bacterium]MDR7468337.1 hypothetical protein [Armatimonadota bacterium]MDR7495270.1 hypothetical protein [Armatimonadota bacterium]MDR7500512.1 hypothetical protein [Armatimonadota bacterium]